jgi:hypothetical protein
MHSIHLECEIQLLLGDKVNDFDENVKWGVARNDASIASRKETAADALETTVRGRIALAANANNVHPASGNVCSSSIRRSTLPKQSVKGLECYSRHLRVFVSETGQCLRQKLMPIAEEELGLTYAEQACLQWVGGLIFNG